MKKLNQKTGFTLAELLIVVAIIAILVAIGIPAFSTAMERSRETVDLSNIRGAYAEFMAGSLGGNANVGYYKLDIKQRNYDDWVIDVSGFLTNVVSGDGSAMTAADMPKPTKTGLLWVCFESTKTEKPTVRFVTGTDDAPTAPTGFPNTTTKYNPEDTNPSGYVSSGDGWWLCKSGL